MQKLIAWVEIPTENFDRAVDFYNAILNLNLKKMDFGHEKMACLPGDEGAITYAEGYKPGKDGVLVSLQAGNKMDSMLEKIQRNGGSILQEKTKIEAEDRDFFAVFTDTEGNKLGLYGK